MPGASLVPSIYPPGQDGQRKKAPELTTMGLENGNTINPFITAVNNTHCKFAAVHSFLFNRYVNTTQPQ